MKRIIFPAEIKASGNAGSFAGYASIFENVDLGGDVIRKHAFKEIVANASGQVKVLFQHDSAGGLPIGLATVEQNARGLKFDGTLVMDDPFVQRVHAHMKAGTLDGMSIGYDILPGGAKMLQSGIRELTALKLWEISAVTFGMNPKAHIEDVKSIPEFGTIREAEAWVRDELCLSNEKAKAFIACFRKALMAARDGPESWDEMNPEVRKLVERIRSLAIA